MKTLLTIIIAALCFMGCDASLTDPRLPTKSFWNTTWESESTSRVILRPDSIIVYERGIFYGQYDTWRRNAWGIKGITQSTDSLMLEVGGGWVIIAYRDGASLWIALWKNAPGIFRQYF